METNKEGPSVVNVPMKARFMGRVRRVHFVGVGGAGMCGIAEVLASEGYSVSGSDLEATPVTRHLERSGVRVHIGHDASNIGDADVLVASTAIPPTNEEILAARKQGIAVIPRAEMLGELMRFSIGIAVAGSHGKTTTTSMIAAIFEHAGADPTYVIGGLLRGRSGNARFGKGKHLIAEADESDASFLHLLPGLAVVTNIDRDHLSAYDGDFDKLKDTFIRFAQRLPFYGALLACADDQGVMDIMPALTRPVITYGLAKDADYCASHVHRDALTWRFTAHRPGGRPDIEVCVSPPGDHNLLNALAAVAAATEQGIADESICQGLAGFHGVGRRFEVHADCRAGGTEFTLVDDYGHHPREISAVIDTARSVWPDKRLVMAFQPHRYTRTRDLFDEFVEVLGRVDALVLLSTYAAGENPIRAAQSHDLFNALRERGLPKHKCLARAPKDATEALRHLIRSGDIVLVQGAGNVNLVTAGLLAESGAVKEQAC